MNDNGRPLVMIVEDDKRLSHINCYALESEGYEVRVAYTLAEARGALKDISPDVILLDVKLPDGSGFDLCREIREDIGAYIIFLTSVRESSGELEGLVAGGDDYLRKPYGIELLCARVKKGLRQEWKAPQIIRHGLLTLDVIASQAYIGGEDLALTKKEFALLSLFVQNESRAISAETLYEKIWGQPMGSDANAIRKQVSRLRKKLAGTGLTVSTERGEGYCFERE